MSSELKLVSDVFSNELTDFELKTAKEEWSEIKDAFMRQMNSTSDLLKLAGSLLRVRSRHGKNSTIYREFLETLSYYNEDWRDKHKRDYYIQAYKGYQCLPGSEDEIAKAASNIKSLSGFIALNDVPHNKLPQVTSKLQRQAHKATARDIRSLYTKPKAPTQPQICPQVEAEVVATEAEFKVGNFRPQSVEPVSQSKPISAAVEKEPQISHVKTVLSQIKNINRFIERHPSFIPDELKDLIREVNSKI